MTHLKKNILQRFFVNNFVMVDHSNLNHSRIFNHSLTFTANAITSKNCCLKNIVSSLSKISNYNNVYRNCCLKNIVSSLSKIYITFTASAITSKNCCLKNIVSSLSKIYITFTASAITSKKYCFFTF